MIWHLPLSVSESNFVFYDRCALVGKLFNEWFWLVTDKITNNDVLILTDNGLVK